MAAPKENDFWRLRSKHGRDKIFSAPEKLRESACEFFQWCDEHPWHKKEAIKSGNRAGELVSIPTQRPYTLTGLCHYIGISLKTWSNYKNTPSLADTIAEIENICYTQKLEGAMVGAFNANIIARDLGLAEKQEIDSSACLAPVINLLPALEHEKEG